MTNLASFLAAHRARREREEEDLPALQAEAWREARAAAMRIVNRVGASTVLLFGSLPRGRFGRGSDIDLAVAGLLPGRLVDALAAAEEGCPFAVDVVPLDQMRADVAATVRGEGIVLWPR